ncbi:hypothetical protein ARMSODRAFT_1040194, partial [Armillaria solidipes]
TLYGVFHLAPDGTIDLYPWSTWSLVGNVPWALTMIVADAFLIYRTYVVWMQKYIVIVIPLLLFAADVGAAIYFLVRIGTSTTTLVQLTNATTIFAAVMLAANIVCTALISFCIWMVRRNISETRQGFDPLSGVIALIVESAAVCTVVLIAQIITLGLRSPIHNVLFDIQAPIIGIVFSMIIIRVSREEAQGDTNKSTDGIAWHHSTTDESAANVETMFRTITSTHSDDVGAQHEDSKASTETNSESTRYNLDIRPAHQIAPLALILDRYIGEPNFKRIYVLVRRRDDSIDDFGQRVRIGEVDIAKNLTTEKRTWT